VCGCGGGCGGGRREEGGWGEEGGKEERMTEVSGASTLKSVIETNQLWEQISD